MLFWRPILDGVVSYSEANNMLSLSDLLKLNDLIDMKRDISQYEAGTSK